MANASWPYNNETSITALRTQLDRFDQAPPEDQGEGAYQASMASLVRAARDVAVDKPKPKHGPKRRLLFARAT